MASWRTFFCIVFSLLCCCSAVTVPFYCDRCKVNKNDPYCQYCCSMYKCCGSETPMEQCSLVACDCKPATTTTTISTTTPTTTTPSTTTPSTTTPATTPTTTIPTTTKAPRHCALPSGGVSTRILGGESLSVCERPWMVHFTVDVPQLELKLPACAGVLVSDTQILTSKQCADQFLVNSLPGSTIVAKFADSVKYLETKREVTKENIVTDGDIALVNFSPRVPVHEDFCIQPVCLPDESTVFTEDENQKCKIASWGLPEPVTTLKEADVSLMASAACRLVLAALSSVDVNIKSPADAICTNPQSSKGSACKLDEGGMLLCQDQGDERGQNWILAGLTFGSPCNSSLPSTFVNVTSNLEFITSKLS